MTVNFAETWDEASFLFPHSGQTGFEVWRPVCCFDHACVKLLDALSLKDPDLGRNLIIEARSQQRSYLLHRAEGQIVLNVDISRVNLIPQVLCCPIELRAHHLGLIDRLKQTGLPGCVIRQHHGGLFH